MIATYAATVALPGDVLADQECTSQARHSCSQTAAWVCQGDGQRVVWCQPRYEDWVLDVSKGVRCRWCKQSQGHWRVVPA